MSKQYSIKTKAPNIILFSAVSCFSVLMFFSINSGGSLSFPKELITYAAAFATAFKTALTAVTFAINTPVKRGYQTVEKVVLPQASNK